ncbi:MAG TPA: hypothetical protein VHD59_02515 [Pseudolabrys sp.]|nr:hypothetical protein [Pseudolabrys sp.]
MNVEQLRLERTRQPATNETKFFAFESLLFFGWLRFASIGDRRASRFRERRTAIAPKCETGERNQRKANAAKPRLNTIGRSRIPGKKTDDAAIGICHRLHLACARRWLLLELQVNKADAPLDHANEAWIDFRAATEHRAVIADSRLQRRTAARRVAPAIAPGPIIATDNAQQRRAKAGGRDQRRHTHATHVTTLVPKIRR